MSRRSSISSTRRRMCAGSTPRFSMPYASSSSTRSSTNEAAGSCGTNADHVGEPPRRVGQRVAARPSGRGPANVPPVKCGTRPLAARRNVDFPAPVGPTTARANVPSSMATSTSRQRGAVRVGVAERRRRRTRSASPLTTSPRRRGGRAPAGRAGAIAAISAGSARRPGERRRRRVQSAASGPGRGHERAGRDAPRRAAIATAAGVQRSGRYRVRRPRPCPRASIDSASVTASSIPVSSTGTASAGQRPPPRRCGCPAAAAPRAPGRPWRSSGARSTARAPPPAPARGTGGARGGRPPSGSVTELNVPNTTSSAASRAPSSAAYATVAASTVPRNTSAVRSAIAIRPADGERAERRAPLGPGSRARRVDEPRHRDQQRQVVRVGRRERRRAPAHVAHAIHAAGWIRSRALTRVPPRAGPLAAARRPRPGSKTTPRPAPPPARRRGRHPPRRRRPRPPPRATGRGASADAVASASRRLDARRPDSCGGEAWSSPIGTGGRRGSSASSLPLARRTAGAAGGRLPTSAASGVGVGDGGSGTATTPAAHVVEARAPAGRGACSPVSPVPHVHPSMSPSAIVADAGAACWPTPTPSSPVSCQ